MRNLHRFCLCLLPISIFFLLNIVPPFSVLAADDREVDIRHVSGKIQIDGILDDPAWQEKPSAIALVQVEPHPGEPATEATKVWLGYNRDSLYIAVRCEDRNPKQIVATDMQRDAEVKDNDNIEIIRQILAGRNEK